MSNDNQALARIAPAHQEVEPFQPATIDQAWQLSEWLAEAAILPNHLRKRPSDVFATLLYGRELGLTPMQALLGVDIIEGTPGLDAQTAVALVKSSPVCKYFTCRETTNERAVFETHRVGEPTPTSLAYTIQDADQAGLVGKTSTGKPNNYLRHPRAMLAARASMALAKLVYQDILKGCNSKEDLAEIQERATRDEVTPPPPPPSSPAKRGAHQPIIDVKSTPTPAASSAGPPPPATPPPASKGPTAAPEIPADIAAQSKRDLASQRKAAKDLGGEGADAAPKQTPSQARPGTVAGGDSPPPPAGAADEIDPPWAEEPSDAARELMPIVSAAETLDALLSVKAWERIIVLAPSIERGDLMAAYGGALERAFAKVAGPGPELGALTAECQRISKDMPPDVRQLVLDAYKAARDRKPA